MSDTAAAEKEKHIMKQLKRRMECWREVVLPINSILLWEKPWYPGVIFGFTTTIFLLICMLEPGFLTLISICLLILTLVDYLVPTISSKFVSPNAWNGQKERKLEKICQELSETILHLQNTWKFLLNARDCRPNTYYGSITLCLLLLAWIGNMVNNLFLIYLAVTILLLTPGLRHKGRAQEAVKYAYNYVMHRKLS